MVAVLNTSFSFVGMVNGRRDAPAGASTKDHGTAYHVRPPADIAGRPSEDRCDRHSGPPEGRGQNFPGVTDGRNDRHAAVAVL
jgi:hypothetical protein